MANTSSRTLRLLSLLQNHRYWTGAELSERLGVSARTLRRDVERLRELGYPVQAHRGVDGGYQLTSGAALPPLVVDDEEAVALAVGLRLAAQETAPGYDIAEPAARALAKVTQVMPPRLRRQVEAVAAVTEPATWGAAARPAPGPEVLVAAALACRDAERVRFGYTSASGERTDRHVEPHRLVVLERRWYLVGYDLTRNDWRSFRLDRLAGPPTPTGARFRPRALPAADAGEFVRAGIAGAPADYADYEVEALVEAPAAVVRERIGRWAAVEEAGPGRCRVRMTPPANPDWPVIALGVAGADFRLLAAPPELATRIRDWGGRLGQAGRAGKRAEKRAERRAGQRETVPPRKDSTKAGVAASSAGEPSMRTSPPAST